VSIRSAFGSIEGRARTFHAVAVASRRVAEVGGELRAEGAGRLSRPAPRSAAFAVSLRGAGPVQTAGLLLTRSDAEGVRDLREAVRSVNIMHLEGFSGAVNYYAEKDCENFSDCADGEEFTPRRRESSPTAMGCVSTR